MSRKAIPTKSRVIRKKNTLLNSQKRSDINSRESDSLATRYQVKLRQLYIDKYNNAEIYVINDYFKNLSLSGEQIIIRIFKENFIKQADESNPNDPQYDYFFRLIDARKRTTDEPTYVSTPFPYIEKGVIVAISPELQLKYYKQKEELAKYDKEAADKLIVPKQGDVIEIRSNYSSVWFKDKRYYIDKQEQCVDLVKGPDELTLIYFDHYYKFDSFDFVGVDGSAEKKGFFKEDTPDWYNEEIAKYNESSEELLDKLNEIQKNKKDSQDLPSNEA